MSLATRKHESAQCPSLTSSSRVDVPATLPQLSRASSKYHNIKYNLSRIHRSIYCSVKEDAKLKQKDTALVFVGESIMSFLSPLPAARNWPAREYDRMCVLVQSPVG